MPKTRLELLLASVAEFHLLLALPGSVEIDVSVLPPNNFNQDLNYYYY